MSTECCIFISADNEPWQQFRDLPELFRARRTRQDQGTAELPAPEYRDNAFMLNVTIRNGVINETDEVINDVINEAINISSTEQAVLAALKKRPRITKVELQKETSLGKSTIDRAMKGLKEKCLIECVVSNKTGYWKIINKGL